MTARTIKAPKRKPFQDLLVTTGTQNVQDYRTMKQKNGRFYLKDFMKSLKMVSVKGRFLEISPGRISQTRAIIEKYNPKEIVGLVNSPRVKHYGDHFIKQMQLEKKFSLKNGSVEKLEQIENLGSFDFIYSSFSLHQWLDPLIALKPVQCTKSRWYFIHLRLSPKRLMQFPTIE